MFNDNSDILNLLREEREARLHSIPTQNRFRTPVCPSIGLYATYAIDGWPEKLTFHAASCDYCQNRLATVWSVECPGWGPLQDYLNNEAFPNKKAVERHLRWEGCGACSARLKLLQATSQSMKREGEWFTFHLGSGAQTTTGAGRPAVSVVERLDDIPLVITVEEQNASLRIQVSSTGGVLAGKSVELRLAGERFETRCELQLERQGDQCWAEATVLSSEQRLRDLAGQKMLSVRLHEQSDMPVASDQGATKGMLDRLKGLLPDSFPTLMPVHMVTASGRDEQSEEDASPTDVQIGAFFIGDHKFALFQSTRSNETVVLLRGLIPEGARILISGHQSFELGPSGTETERVVMGLTPLGAERLLIALETDAALNQITFG
jgi:hypothetical protein